MAILLLLWSVGGAIEPLLLLLSRIMLVDGDWRAFVESASDPREPLSALLVKKLVLLLLPVALEVGLDDADADAVVCG